MRKEISRILPSSFWTRGSRCRRRAASGQQIVYQQHAAPGLECVHVYGDVAVHIPIILLLVSLVGEFAFFRMGTNPARSFMAAAAAKMKPRASMPPRRQLVRAQTPP